MSPVSRSRALSEDPDAFRGLIRLVSVLSWCAALFGFHGLFWRQAQRCEREGSLAVEFGRLVAVAVLAYALYAAMNAPLTNNGGLWNGDAPFATKVFGMVMVYVGVLVVAASTALWSRVMDARARRPSGALAIGSLFAVGFATVVGWLLWAHVGTDVLVHALAWAGVSPGSLLVIPASWLPFVTLLAGIYFGPIVVLTARSRRLAGGAQRGGGAA